jgi:hypothetical protein
MFQQYVYFVDLYILNVCSYLYFKYVNVFNFNFQYIKVQQIYTTILQRNVDILTTWLIYTMSAVYKIG